MPVLPGLGKAHEFWIEPLAYQAAPGAAVKAGLRNGQGFKGVDLPWFDRRNVRVEAWVAGRMMPLTGRAGDIPALSVPEAEPGVLVLLHQAAPARLTYAGWEVFLSFLDHKDLDWALEAHAARGLPQEDVTEVYSRFSKAVVRVGAAPLQGTVDVPTGMEVEFVALADPAAIGADGEMPVRLLYRDAPRADAQVEVYEKDAEGQVVTTRLRTDAAGEVRVPVRGGRNYLLDHVVLREPAGSVAGVDGKPAPMWESLWASMTFAVPG